MSEGEGSTPGLLVSSLVPVVMVVAVAVFATMTAGSTSVTAQEASGAELYAANCAACHQAGGEGVAGTFPPLTGNPAAQDADYVASVILDGKTGPIEVLGVAYENVMPPFTALTPSEVAAIADHVVNLSGGASETDTDHEPASDTVTSDTSTAAPSVGDADRGRDLFTGSNQLSAGGTSCASCHTAGDVGMSGGTGLGPDLTDVHGRFGGDAGLSAWLSNPASPTMRPVFTDRQLTATEVADLTAFLAETAEQAEPDSSGIDWLPISGFGGFIVLVSAMSIARIGRRRPYRERLAAKTAHTTTTTSRSAS